MKNIIVVFIVAWSLDCLAVPMYSGQTTYMFDANGTGTSSSATGLNVTSALTTPPAKTVTQASVTIGTSAVRLTVNGSAPASTRVLLVFQLDSASTASCYLGSSTVTTTGSTKGILTPASQIFSFNSDAGDYWAICGAASQTFHIMEQE